MTVINPDDSVREEQFDAESKSAETNGENKKVEIKAESDKPGKDAENLQPSPEENSPNTDGEDLQSSPEKESYWQERTVKDVETMMGLFKDISLEALIVTAETIHKLDMIAEQKLNHA